MYDIQRIVSLLDRIEAAIALIDSGTKNIYDADDFLISPSGVFTMSAVCMQLILIGESVKAIDTHSNGALLSKYPHVPWHSIMGLRNIIPMSIIISMPKRFLMSSKKTCRACSKRYNKSKTTYSHVVANQPT